ncbi:hypothetical protein GKE82_25530 [Conexibacter sp. W3-3-2]|nr:hypothetical protein [Conexibacter sp. W3-3-2]MTD47431.1 hypothetical protein [Conexibacter sp. W3-3-2]MTD47570.1 hypothetical protein [Conexibacter sp. W3-3-2]
MLWLTVASGFAVVAGPQTRARMAGVMAVYVPTAVVHGYALLAALVR